MESCHTGPSWFQDLLPKNAMCANVCTWKLEDMTPHGRVCTCHGCLFQCSHTWTLVRQIMFDTQEMANIHKLLQLTFLFAAMTGKSRLGPDPSISINDLQRKINEVMQRQGCRDLNKLLHSRHAVSWKTSPDPEWLAVETLVIGLLLGLGLLVGIGLLLLIGLLGFSCTWSRSCLECHWSIAFSNIHLS